MAHGGGMNAVAFDTLKFAQTLRDKAHVPQEQAEGIAQAFADATSEQIATKADISDLRIELADAKAEIVKWMFGAIGLQTIVIIGAVIALTRAVH